MSRFGCVAALADRTAGDAGSQIIAAGKQTPLKLAVAFSA
jgi:hypothetical protein